MRDIQEEVDRTREKRLLREKGVQVCICEVSSVVNIESNIICLLPYPPSELEKKREAKQREREAREREARKREKAEEKEKRRKEYNAQMAAAAAREQQKKKSEEKKKKNGQAAGETEGLDNAPLFLMIK